MEQDDRLSIMKDFKRGKYGYLVATDVAARGIDIENVSLIINYDIPLKMESYIHRTGRTGRAGLDGKAITFVTSKQKHYMRNIMEYISYDIPVLKAPTEDEIAKCRVDFDAKLMDKPILKKPKNEQLNKEIMTLYVNGGKKKKLRATNFVGVISNIEGVTAEDIGIIRITDTCTYIDILNNKGPQVLKALSNITICGRKLKVSKAKNI
jgi:superfamily II DNA/RNA helicase